MFCSATHVCNDGFSLVYYFFWLSSVGIVHPSPLVPLLAWCYNFLHWVFSPCSRLYFTCFNYAVVSPLTPYWAAKGTFVAAVARVCWMPTMCSGMVAAICWHPLRSGGHLRRGWKGMASPRLQQITQCVSNERKTMPHLPTSCLIKRGQIHQCCSVVTTWLLFSPHNSDTREKAIQRKSPFTWLWKQSHPQSQPFKESKNCNSDGNLLNHTQGDLHASFSPWGHETRETLCKHSAETQHLFTRQQCWDLSFHFLPAFLFSAAIY